MSTQISSHKAQLVASVLDGSWRQSDSGRLELDTADLDQVTPLLYGSGAAALGWWRIRHSSLKDTPSGELLHQAYRLLALQSAIHEQKIVKVFRLLREATIEAILVKGWAAARLYPDSALRPYGDIDLLVRPRDYNHAQEVLSHPDARDCWVDLHQSFMELSERNFEDLFRRTERVSLEEEGICILSAEDHLALLSIHLLRHGAWRPLWLCDIGAAIESLPGNFDWSLCLGCSQRRAGWITCAIGLAHRLLGARLNGLPIASAARNNPHWLPANVLRQWESPFASKQPPMNHSAPMADYVRDPTGIVTAVRERWPNPILATVSVNGRFNRLPRLPYQLGNCLLRATRFVTDSRLRRALSQ
ncbi:MAG TPA: nucleotidyltransferase family protein [Pyrinomonadaceae bacterium]|nr:nucleotidyltransferase family protein [Pyrinomonadaceae bacterium]